MTIEQPLFSVIIPCFNQGSFITDAVESVLNSTYSNIEIIIVDDGSDDQVTRIIIEKINHPQITKLIISNNGLANARNVGILGSTGKYILPLDADDKISPTYIEKAVKILEEHLDVKLVICDVQLFGADKGIKELPKFSMEVLIGQNTMVCSSVFRRIDYNATNGYNVNMKFGFEDWDFWLSLLGNGGEVYKLNEIHFYYRIKNKSMITGLGNDNEKLKYSRRMIYENHKELYSQYFFDPTNSFEYSALKSSAEYRLGTILLWPIRVFMRFINIIKA